MTGANSSKKFVGLILAIAVASLIAAIVAYGSISPMQRQAEAKDALDRVIVTKTVTSIPDPGAGHASHQVAMFMPPLGEDVVYSGTLTWTASGPVELFTYHHYDGPTDTSPPLYIEPSNNTTYASPLFFTAPDYSDHGSMQLAANAFGFHTLEGTEFTVTATFDGWTKKAELPSSDRNIIPQATISWNMNYTVLTESEIQDLLDAELKGWQITDGKASQDLPVWELL